MKETLEAINGLKSQLSTAREELLAELCEKVRNHSYEHHDSTVISERGAVCTYSPDTAEPSRWGVIVRVWWDEEKDGALVGVLDGEDDKVVEVTPDLVIETEALCEFIDSCEEDS